MDSDEALFIQDAASTITTHAAHMVSRDAQGVLMVWTRNLGYVAKMLTALRRPKTITELCAETKLSRDVVLQCLEALQRTNLVKQYVPDDIIPAQPTKCHSIILGICGSIQAAFMLPIASRLQSSFAAEVHVIFTETAEGFASLYAYRKLGFTVWDHKSRGPEQFAGNSHMHLARSTTMCLVAPATANFLSRMAAGTCSDFLSLIALAHHGPVVIAPCMNPAMLNSPAVGRNLEQLRADGFYIVEPRPAYNVCDGYVDTSQMAGLGVSENNVCGVLRAVLEASSMASQRHAPAHDLQAVS